MAYDLILRGGRVIDPSQNLDGIADVAFAGGKVAAVVVLIREQGHKVMRGELVLWRQPTTA